jgi:hypothetical protein
LCMGTQMDTALKLGFVTLDLRSLNIV